MVKDNTKISGFIVDTLPKISLLVGVISAVLSFYFYQQDHHRFFFSYLTAFFFFLTVQNLKAGVYTFKLKYVRILLKIDDYEVKK